MVFQSSAESIDKRNAEGGFKGIVEKFHRYVLLERFLINYLGDFPEVSKEMS